MTKTIELNERNVKKYATIITAKAIVLSMISAGFFIVPIGDRNIIEEFSYVFKGVDITARFVVLALYAVCIAYNIISSWIKIVLFKNRCSISFENKAGIMKSRFAQFEMNDSLTTLIMFAHTAVFLYLIMSSMNESSSSFEANVPYITYFTIYLIFVLVFSIMLKKLHKTFQDLRMNVNLHAMANAEAEKYGIVSNDTPKAESQPSMQDQKSNLDALVKYKQLYDSGAITEEEYNKKRDELLNGNK